MAENLPLNLQVRSLISKRPMRTEHIHHELERNLKHRLGKMSQPELRAVVRKMPDSHRASSSSSSSSVHPSVRPSVRHHHLIAMVPKMVYSSVQHYPR